MKRERIRFKFPTCCKKKKKMGKKNYNQISTNDLCGVRVI